MQRIADRRLARMLEVFGAVCVEGPRGCGKTWTSLNMSNSAFMIADPTDNFANRQLVSNNVEYAFRGDTPHLIDEWQEFPHIWDATKIKVDDSRMNGRFILTGSSTPVNKGVYHSGTGRIGSMRMRTMSLFESGDSDGSVSLASLFDGADIFTDVKTISLEDIISLTVRGGWPRLIGTDAGSALEVHKDYVMKTVRDASRLEGGCDETKMTMVFRSLARNEGTVASNATIARDVAEFEDDTVTDQTVSKYIELLKRVFVVEDQPSFNANARSSVKVGKSPKRRLTDPSLAVATMGLNEERLMRDLRTFGYLFESMCIRDLNIYAEASGGSVYHYRDDKGREADAVVEWSDGRWGAFEIKTGTDKIDEGVRSLMKVRKVYENQGWPLPEFLCVICGTAPAAYRRDDGVYVVPITCLGP